jgi:hypothetical protein
MFQTTKQKIINLKVDSHHRIRTFSPDVSAAFCGACGGGGFGSLPSLVETPRRRAWRGEAGKMKEKAMEKHGFT